MVNSLKNHATQILVAVTLLLCLWAVGMWIYRYMGNYGIAASWMSTHRGLILALVLLNVGDIITTEIALRQSKGKGELNPLARNMFKKRFGKIELYLTKMSLIFLIIAFLSLSQDAKLLLFTTIAFGLVCLNNLRSIAMWLLAPEFSKVTRSAPTSFQVYLIRITEVFLIAAFCVYGIPHLI